MIFHQPACNLKYRAVWAAVSACGFFWLAIAQAEQPDGSVDKLRELSASRTSSGATHDKSPATTATSSSSIKPVELTASKIAGLIANLGSADYHAREQATQELIAAGPVVLEPLTKAAESTDFEISYRAMRVLQLLLGAQDRGVHERAAKVMESWAVRQANTNAGLAADALLLYRLAKQDQIIDDLKQLGATVSLISTDYSLFSPGALHVEIKGTWTGKKADLDLLKQIPRLQWLTFVNIPLDDDGLTVVAELTDLLQVDLFKTGVSDESAKDLARRLPGVRVDRRKGGLLGVRGSAGTGCRVRDVPPGTAASQAGIVENDEILSIDGRKVQSFEELTGYIGTKNGGDQVKLEIRRGDEVFEKDVTLGAWD